MRNIGYAGVEHITVLYTDLTRLFGVRLVCMNWYDFFRLRTDDNFTLLVTTMHPTILTVIYALVRTFFAFTRSPNARHVVIGPLGDATQRTGQNFFK